LLFSDVKLTSLQHSKHQLYLAQYRRLIYYVPPTIFYPQFGARSSARDLHSLLAQTPNVAHAPLLLCRICSSWRNIAINMPELWQSLNIGPSFRLPCDKRPTDRNDLGALDAEQGGVVCEHYVLLVKGWFGRAKEQPLLSLYFWFDMQDEWSELHKNNSILLISEILVVNAQHFRYLDVGADRAMYLQNFLTDSSSVKLNHLESLVIHIHNLKDVGLGIITTLRLTPNKLL
jgi:hypothetical protein